MVDPISLFTILASLGILGGSAAAGYFGNKGKQGGTTTQNTPQGNRTTLESSGSLLGGIPAEILDRKRFTPEQENALKQLLGPGLQNVLSNLNNPAQQFQLPALLGYSPTYNPMNFQNIEKSALENFNSKIVPTLAERFASLGGSGTARSSGFPAALSSAGRGLATDLAALRNQYEFAGQNIQTQQGGLAAKTAAQNAALQLQAQQFNQGNINNKYNAGLQALQFGLTPQFESTYFPPQAGLGQPLAQGLGYGLGSGGFSALGSALSGLFK
jgi:hypothetical protein